MGCDIHAQIDYDWITKWKMHGKEHSNTDTLQFCVPQFPREYSLFALMAGGLRDGRWKSEKVFEPRGLPEKLSYDTLNNYSLHVSDDEWTIDADDYCTTEQAKRWTTPYSEKIGASSIWMNEEHTIVSGPDWHTASWLTPDEFEICLNRYNEQFDNKVRPHAWAILGAMQALEKQGCTVRLVFWFDN